MADTVLIVDDDQAVLTVLCKVVRSNGIEAVTASSAEQALSLMDGNTYDLVLMDINMHGLDGFQAVQAIRGRGIKTPIIIVSARGEDYDTIYGLGYRGGRLCDQALQPGHAGGKDKGPYPPQPGPAAGGGQRHQRRAFPVQHQHPALL